MFTIKILTTKDFPCYHIINIKERYDSQAAERDMNMKNNLETKKPTFELTPEMIAEINRAQDKSDSSIFGTYAGSEYDVDDPLYNPWDDI